MTSLASRTDAASGRRWISPWPAALSVGIALSWNFTLNRYLTFSYARRGSIVRQFVTYVLSNARGSP